MISRRRGSRNRGGLRIRREKERKRNNAIKSWDKMREKLNMREKKERERERERERDCNICIFVCHIIR